MANLVAIPRQNASKHNWQRNNALTNFVVLALLNEPCNRENLLQSTERTPFSFSEQHGQQCSERSQACITTKKPLLRLTIQREHSSLATAFESPSVICPNNAGAYRFVF